MTRERRPMWAPTAIPDADRRNNSEISAGDTKDTAHRESELRSSAAKRLLDAMEEGLWSRRSTDLELVSQLVSRAAVFEAVAEEAVVS